MSEQPALFRLSLYEVGLLAEATGRTNQQIMDEQMVVRCEHGRIDPHYYTEAQGALTGMLCPGSPTLRDARKAAADEVSRLGLIQESLEGEDE